MEEDDVVAQLVEKSVPDAVWWVLHGVNAGGGDRQPIPGFARETQTAKALVNSWSVSLRSAHDVTEIPLDPLMYPESNGLPIDLTLTTLDRLQTDGWSVVHVSEDRAIDDGASTSFVVRQRFLLHRAQD